MGEAVNNLLTAIEIGRTDIVRSVLSALERNEVDTNSEVTLEHLLQSSLTPDGTILHMASKLGQIDIVRALLAAGSDPGIHNDDNHTPLDLAVNDKVKEVFSEQLLQCVALSNVGRVCQLIASGVDVNLKDTPESGNTPLHWAASYGNKDIIHCLCKRGADVNQVNCAGALPLHDAVNRGDIEVVEELLKAGAKMDIKAESGIFAGKTPLNLAKDKPAIVKVLQTGQNYQLVNGVLDDSQTDRVDVSVQKLQAVNSDHGDTSINSTISPIPRRPLNNVLQFGQNSVEELSSPTGSAADLEEPFSTKRRLMALWPRPQKVLFHEGVSFKLEGSLSVFLTPMAQADTVDSVCDVMRTLQPQVEAIGLELHIEMALTGPLPMHTHLLCELNPHLFNKPNSYRLSFRHKQVRLTACDREGLYYGMSTLLDVIKCFGDEGVPPLNIHDSPCLSRRGVMLDMSKGRIPTLDSLKTTLRSLAHMKINEVHLYHRFHAPTETTTAWQFPLSNSMLLDIELYCRRHCIRLLPVLDVTPNVSYQDLPLLSPVLRGFLSCFPKPSVLCLGPRLSSLLVDISDDGIPNTSDAFQLLPISPDQTLQLCAYVFHESPDSLQHFPPNTIIAEYGFQADYDFDYHSAIYEEAGVPFCTVPGTAAWNSLAGCPEATVSNIHSAAQSAVSHGALGMLVAHWSGVGHITHLCMAWPGLLVAAGLAWNSDISLDFLHERLADLLNIHLLSDLAGCAGQVMVELGRAETFLSRCSRNQQGSDNSDLPAEKGSTLFQLLTDPDQVALEHLTIDMFQKTMRHIRKCQSELAKVDLHCDEGPIMVRELQLTADLMLTASRIGRALTNAGKNMSGNAGFSVVNFGVANLTPTNKTDLANRLLSQVDTYRAVWLSRQLPLGLQDSLLSLSLLLKQFVPENSQNPS